MKSVSIDSLFINSVSIVAPGIENWQQFKNIVAGSEEYKKTEMPKFVPDILPANERRRTTALIKMVLHAATEAVKGSDIVANEMSSVFSSAVSDLKILDRICSDLLLEDHPVSPIQFHNSVHNAPAGYWSIGTGSRHPSNSIAAGLGCAVVGLIEAGSMALIEHETVLLVIYDCPGTGLLRDAAQVEIPFACAMVLTAQQSAHSIAKIQLLGSTEMPCQPLENKALAGLCADNMAAYGLLLLEPIARNESKTVSMPHTTDLQYRVSIEPCEAVE